MLNTIMECVPNFSEGRDLAKVEKIVDAFRGKEGVKLLDYSSDKDHNRTVVTVIGEIEPLGDAVIEAIGVAAQLIDLRHHQGEHPRMGAADVVPFIPIKNCTVQDADALAKRVGKEAAERFQIPSFLYEKSATAPHRENLAAIRKGQFEGMFEKMKLPEWKPDFGPDAPHPTAGVFAVGARMPLVAFNVNLDTPNLQIAKDIAARVRHSSGGYAFIKALGVMLEARHIAQVSMNLTDYTHTAVYRAYEAVKMEARRYGVNVVGTEIIGMVPMAALIDCAEYYLQVENFSMKQVLENNF